MEPNGTRAPRLHVRMPCWLRFSGHEIDAFSSNISSTGLYAKIPQNEMEGVELLVGLRLQVRVRLPHPARTVDLVAEVRWINPSDFDVDGRPVFGFGMNFVEVSDEVAQLLLEFVGQFRYSVMIADDDQTTVELITRVLTNDYRLITCHNDEQVYAGLQSDEVGLLIVGQMVFRQSGIALLRRVDEKLPFSAVTRVVVANDTQNRISDVVNLKIFQWIEKPVRPEELRQIVRRCIEHYAMQQENERLNQELERTNQRLRREVSFLRRKAVGEHEFDGIIGSSPSFMKAIWEVEKVCQSDATVHIRGETGTGKELFARALHDGGPRRTGPFVPQNCGGMTETLIQSTLFGHKKGSFTGAVRDQMGAFQRANGGTLFLDEVAEFPLSVQSSLLRVLQEREITPLGATQPEKVDVRIISATHQNLHEAIEAGRFREDLYFRLVVIEIVIPPLRERIEDIPLLAQHFIRIHCERNGLELPGITKEALKALEHYPWPGNVRELENTLERIIVLSQNGQPISIGQLPEHLQSSVGQLRSAVHAGHLKSIEQHLVADLQDTHDLKSTLEKIERYLILQALQECAGNRTAAAKMLGLPRQTLQSRLIKLRIGS